MADTLKNYTFLPWLRQGVAAEITEVPDNLGGPGLGRKRASVQVSFNSIIYRRSSKTAQLLGPGDIVGINPGQSSKPSHATGSPTSKPIIFLTSSSTKKTFPGVSRRREPLVRLQEANLRPWIFLIVLTEDEFDEQSSSGPLPAFEIKDIASIRARCFPDMTRHVGLGPRARQPKYHWQDITAIRCCETTTADQVRGVEQKLADMLDEPTPTTLLHDCFVRASSRKTRPTTLLLFRHSKPVDWLDWDCLSPANGDPVDGQ